MTNYIDMPPWFRNHGETEIIYYADTGGNDAYEAECKRHFTKSGPRYWTFDQAKKWKCPQCLEESKKHELDTRDA